MAAASVERSQQGAERAEELAQLAERAAQAEKEAAATARKAADDALALAKSNAEDSERDEETLVTAQGEEEAARAVSRRRAGGSRPPRGKRHLARSAKAVARHRWFSRPQGERRAKGR